MPLDGPPPSPFALPGASVSGAYARGTATFTGSALGTWVTYSGGERDYHSTRGSVALSYELGEGVLDATIDLDDPGVTDIAIPRIPVTQVEEGWFGTDLAEDEKYWEFMGARGRQWITGESDPETGNRVVNGDFGTVHRVSGASVTGFFDAYQNTVPGQPVDTPQEGIDLQFFRRTDNPDAETVADYFDVFLGDKEDSKSQWREPGFARFPSPPVVRLMGGGSAGERALLHHAVGLINRALPRHQHLTIGPDAPHIGHVADTSGTANTDSIPHGQMYVYFSDPQSAGFPPGEEGGGFANTRFKHARVRNAWVKQSLEASFVWVNDGAYIPEQQRMGLLLHEMMHALGFYAHLYNEDHPTSLLGPDGPGEGFSARWGSQVPEIDGAALRAAYRLPNGITRDRFSASSLGDWESTSLEMSGSLPTGDEQPMRFGVNLVNDVVVPWASGFLPTSSLARNPEIRGRATWRGELVGLTPGLQTVRGNAEIGISSYTMKGVADFTELQSWRAGRAPGEMGDGTQWGDGSLRYTIAVNGNFVRSTGGDDGTLIGQFYGASHDGVAGSIERPDLTAAFGGARD